MSKIICERAEKAAPLRCRTLLQRHIRSSFGRHEAPATLPGSLPPPQMEAQRLGQKLRM